jgi:peroxiredoxin
MPDFDLQATDGSRIRKSDFVGQHPLLLTFGSIT